MLIDTKILTQIVKSRAGVIPYMSVNGKLYFLLARHKETQELGDFGGGCKKTENALESAIREFREESNGIFEGLYHPEIFESTFAVVNHHMAIIFFPLPDYSWLYLAPTMFAKSDKPQKEISELVWVSLESFEELIQTNNKKLMWQKIQKFLADHFAVKDKRSYLRHRYLDFVELQIAKLTQKSCITC